MKLKFEREREIEGLVRGVKVYEIKPCKRTLNFNGGRKLTLPLPNLVFIIQYNILNGKYIYTHLRLYCSKEPLSSKNNDLYHFITDASGHVCTDHKYDFAIFLSSEELCEFIINHWFELTHFFELDPLVDDEKEEFKYSFNDMPLSSIKKIYLSRLLKERRNFSDYNINYFERLKGSLTNLLGLTEEEKGLIKE